MKNSIKSLLFSPRSRFFFLSLLVFVAFFSLMRLGHFIYFKSDDPGTNLLELLSAFYLGYKFDMRIALLLFAPWVFLSLLPVFDASKNYFSKVFWTLYFSLAATTAFVFHCFDFAHYSYLHSRLSATILRFAEDPWITAQMMWQSYPILWLLLTIFLFFMASWFWFQCLFNKLITDSKDYESPRLSIADNLIVIMLFSIGFFGGIYGKIGYYPLRWSEAFASTNPFASHLAMNPIHYFFDTLTNHDIGYEEQLLKKHYTAVANHLGIENADPNKLLLHRPLELTPEVLTQAKPNIVVIVMESLAAFKTSAFDHPLDPTPEIKKVADQGLLFTNFYTPSEGTARSIFCLISGVPDLNSHRTSSRNPLVVNQNTLANAFTNYEKFYFIGGSANWGNIRGVIGNNILGVNIIEEGHYNVERTDVWGLSDLQLFEEAHRILAARTSTKPFFTIIQAASFHRPYTIPKQRGKFRLQTVPKKKLSDSGFISNAEFNSIRFSDYSLGEFFRLAKKSKYFKNTLFVVIGDHGLPDNRAKQLSAASLHFALERFHTPLIFYGPHLLKSPPAKIALLASEPDILATLAGVTGHAFNNSSLGRNLFHLLKKPRPSYAFVSAYYTNPLQIGLIGERFYALGTSKGIDALYDLRSDQPNKDVKSDYPMEYRNMSSLTLGLYQASRYLLYNNPKFINQKK